MSAGQLSAAQEKQNGTKGETKRAEFVKRN
jgi:hypothetical protein